MPRISRCATTDADIRIDRRGHPQRPTQMARSKITLSLERLKEA
ncbi:hypothetical protein [Leyella stercorea]